MEFHLQLSFIMQLISRYDMTALITFMNPISMFQQPIAVCTQLKMQLANNFWKQLKAM